ncbi:MAG: hypothetical protein EOO81_02235 [Oxalobacteraceae bacterium]|nr:MAG: hypothetical protein EOO81_02235 [Oxalobacteraceae bacterium]
MNRPNTLVISAAFACAIAVAPPAWAQVPVPDAENTAMTMADQVRLNTATKLVLRESGVLYVYKDTVSGKKAWLPATCQPAKGDQVKLTDFNANAGGVRGVNSAQVRVTQGHCQGAAGWVGTTYIDALK